jgi:hypothetical protein
MATTTLVISGSSRSGTPRAPLSATSRSRPLGLYIRYEGGLSWDEAAQLLQGLLSRPGARGLEVTIFNPNLDPDGGIAHQLCELIGRCVPTAG